MPHVYREGSCVGTCEDFRLCGQWANGQCPVALTRDLWQAKNEEGQLPKH